jgi:tetratricopeptide (TPR) repeat protein
MTCGLAALIVVTPLAIGCVNRLAFVTTELTIFTLVLVWITRSTIRGTTIAANPVWAREARPLLLALSAMTALLALQLTPLPPPILRVLSPAAYHVYQIAFPGWPSGDGRYSVGAARPLPVGGSSAAALPKRSGPRSSGRLASGTASQPSMMDLLHQPRWRPLSLSPAVTSAGLIEFLALGLLFFLVLLHPFRNDASESGEMRTLQRLVYLLVATAVIVAMLGIGERVWWNGKILWFYQPADWTGPLLVDSPRASGPFVNPDHFANYLALTLPLALAGALFPHCFAPPRRRFQIQLLLAGAALLMLIAIALSLSRGGWLAAGVGVTSMLVMSFNAPNLRPNALQRFKLRTVPLAIVMFAFIAGLTFYLIGPARTAVSTRVTTTSASDFSARVGAWQQSLAMIKDFPLFGVGAGAWPEMFPHYQPPPESHYYFFRTAENDYIQFAAENGFSGLVILLAIFTFVLKEVAAAARRVPRWRWPLFAGLLGGVGGGMVQEFVDSSLRIPANALLFAIVLALLLRVGVTEPSRDSVCPELPPAQASTLRWLMVPALLILMIVAWKQDGSAYPYAVEHPADVAVAGRNLLEHPAMSATHIEFAQMIAGASEFQRIELSAAVWLDPSEPLARDLLARNLLSAGRKAEALAQVSASVYRAPFLDRHYYLSPQAIPWLLPDEQLAIARGFTRAIDDDFGDAAGQQASFYLMLGREREAAAAYEHGARTTADVPRRVDFLLQAGGQYARLHDYANGERILLTACRAAPDDARPYAELARDIYGPEKKLAAAAAIVARGIRGGADRYALEMALADTAEMTGRYQLAEAALARAIEYYPGFDAILRLGRVYFAEDRFGRAIASLQRATEVNPHSAEAFIWLGRANEGNYDYYGAERAFRRAMMLAPGDTDARDEYRAFQQRIDPAQFTRRTAK